MLIAHTQLLLQSPVKDNSYTWSSEFYFILTATLCMVNILTDFMMSAPEGSEWLGKVCRTMLWQKRWDLNPEHLTLNSVCISKHQAGTNTAAGGSEPAWLSSDLDILLLFSILRVILRGIYLLDGNRTTEGEGS